jgi:hypothetical protein
MKNNTNGDFARRAYEWQKGCNETIAHLQKVKMPMDNTEAEQFCQEMYLHYLTQIATYRSILHRQFHYDVLQNKFLDGNVPTHLRDKTAQQRFVLTLTHYLWLNGLYELLRKAIGQAKTPSEAAAAARKTLTFACQVLLPGMGYLMLHLLQPGERAIDYLTGLVAAQPVRNWLRTVLEREATNVVKGLFQHLPATITLLAPQPDDPELLIVLKKLPSRAHEMLLDDLGLELDHRRRNERKRGQPLSQQMDIEHVNIADVQDPSEEWLFDK